MGDPFKRQFGAELGMLSLLFPRPLEAMEMPCCRFFSIGSVTDMGCFPRINVHDLPDLFTMVLLVDNPISFQFDAKHGKPWCN